MKNKNYVLYSFFSFLSYQYMYSKKNEDKSRHYSNVLSYQVCVERRQMSSLRNSFDFASFPYSPNDNS
jgi:hypothetical protein